MLCCTGDHQTYLCSATVATTSASELWFDPSLCGCVASRQLVQEQQQLVCSVRPITKDIITAATLKVRGATPCPPPPIPCVMHQEVSHNHILAAGVGASTAAAVHRAGCKASAETGTEALHFVSQRKYSQYSDVSAKALGLYSLCPLLLSALLVILTSKSASMPHIRQL